MTRFAIFATLLAAQFAGGVTGYEEVRQLRIRREPSLGTGEESFRDRQTNDRTYSYAEKNAEAEPRIVRIVEGYPMHVKFKDTLANLTSCKVTAPDETQYDMLNSKGQKIERFGDCGFRMLANRSDSGQWTLTAIVNNTDKFTDRVSVSVYEDRGNPGKMNVISLKHGVEGALQPVTDNVTFCQLEDPNGVQTPLIIGTCRYNIPVVTARHEGNWTVVYGTEGKIIPTSASFRVTTYYDRSVASSVYLTEDNEIQLLCRVHVSEPQRFEYCHFTRPDGHVLSLSPGIGSERYETSKISVPGEETRDLHCGLIIRSPMRDDYGAWRCRITDQNKTSYDSVVRLNSDIRDNKTLAVVLSPNVVAHKVFAKQDDSYQIKCTADAPLSYCWFRSPNGTAYSVSRSKARTPFSLPYVGSGLPSGDCTAEISHASFTDHGEWTCNVGVVNGPEKHQLVTVHVAESYVIPEPAKLMATWTDNITLSCKILPNVTDKAVHYCRWIRPDGYGIYNGVSHRYMTNTNNTRCELIIRGGSHRIEDLGNWTCVAGLLMANSTIEESQATVIVHLKSIRYQTLIGVTVVLSITLMIILCVLSLIQLRKRLRALPADPPPYTAEATPMPRFLKAECGSKEFRY
ncbi:uncharacterized protein LOC143353571 isoform X2 [Halictus rubicundus]|uniref:uncharacterized protein LOC143353571 isoform X2 n=1 Tax=Halictus rubicundus TaxID=77578 RepID=UPI0040375143